MIHLALYKKPYMIARGKNYTTNLSPLFELILAQNRSLEGLTIMLSHGHRSAHSIEHCVVLLYMLAECDPEF